VNASCRDDGVDQLVRTEGLADVGIRTVEVRVGKELTGQADGRTKKIAAQRAARGVYERLLEGKAMDAAAAE